MQPGSTAERLRRAVRRPRARLIAGSAAGLTAALALAACTSGAAMTPDESRAAADSGARRTQVASSGAPSGPSSKLSTPAVITADPLGDGDISPVQPVTVKIANGTLTSVRMTNPAGKAVTGAIAADGASWTNSEDLGYSKTYKITATGRSVDGVGVTKQASVTTLTPGNLTMPYFDTVYGSAVANGATYGVGMVVRMHFDEPVDRAKAERTLGVTTTPSVVGGWFWDDNQDAYWRPKDYYAPGTKVTMTAKVYGKELGDGLYGQADQSVSFVIGAKHVSIADAKTHQVKVYFSDKLVRTMPTSMGRGGTVQGTNGPIYLWTMPGTYTVIGHENPAIMSSDSYGLPANSPAGYAPEKVYWSTKISVDGIYLHQLNATVWAQGHRNLSHGCLNLNLNNARWFYKTSRVGDVVTVVHSGGPALQVWQGGQWSVPWARWVQGSALH